MDHTVKLNNNHVIFFTFRGLTVQTKNITPSSMLCETLKKQVCVWVHRNNICYKVQWNHVLCVMFFRWEHIFATCFSGSAYPCWAQSDQFLPLQGVPDDPRVHRGRGLDLVWEPYPTQHWAGNMYQNSLTSIIKKTNPKFVKNVYSFASLAEDVLWP